ncbi:MAG: hypothetical protein ACKVVO_19010 [Opitutaceae bacterium]
MKRAARYLRSASLRPPNGLTVTLPATAPASHAHAYVLRLSGLTPPPAPTVTDGNPTSL